MRKAFGAVAAQVGVFGLWVGVDLVDVERDEVHCGPMVATIPAIAFQEAVDDVLGVGVFVVDGGDGGDLGAVGHGVIPGRVVGNEFGG